MFAVLCVVCCSVMLVLTLVMLVDDNSNVVRVIFSVVTSGTEDLPDSPRRSALTRTPASVFGSAVKGVNSPLTAPFTPDLTAPFSSPALRPLLSPQVAHRPWLGSVQSPHVTRRNPKLWSTSTGETSMPSLDTPLMHTGLQLLVILIQL